MDATASISNGENGNEVPSSATRIELPAERAAFFFIRAKRLYQLGGRYSAVLERIVTTTLKVLLSLLASLSANICLWFVKSVSLFCDHNLIRISILKLKNISRLSHTIECLRESILVKYWRSS